MEYRILGALQAVRDGAPVRVDAPKQRALLGVLLLHANEVVHRERLVDELWGDRPPATALKTLHVYVSQLRKTLGGDTIVTRGQGYAAEVEVEALDALRFRALVAQARSLDERGEHSSAARAYKAALTLWRGPALSNVHFESLARHEADSLDELRVSVLEEWIDVELALGRHDRLVDELERHVAEHPFRERLREQQMLALYRAGRQADALAAYRDARHTLVAELGLEPMERLQELERAILRHDPALDPPPRSDEPGERPRSSRRPRLLLAGAAAVMIVAAVGTAWLVKDSPSVSRTAAALAGNSVAAIDAETNAVVDEIPIGGRPGGIAAAGGYLWVGNRDGKTLLQIDPVSRRIVRTIGLGAEPTGVAAGAGDLWIAVYADLTVLRVDPTTRDVVERIRVPQGRNVCCGLQIAFGGGSLWVTSYGALFRIDPATNALVNIRPKGWIWSLVYGERALWMMTGVEADRLEGLNPRTHAVLERMNLQRLGHTRNLGVVAAGAGAVWTTVYDDTTVWKIDTATGRIAGTVELGHVPAWASFGAESIWFTTRDGNLVRVDPRSRRVLATTKLGVYPAWLAATADEVWVTTLTP